MAPLLYTSTVNEKLYSCDDKGAHTFWDSLTLHCISKTFSVVGPGNETSLMPSPLVPPSEKWYTW